MYVDHIDIVSKKVKETVEFYKKLGFKVAGTLEGGEVTVLKGGSEEKPIYIDLTDSDWHGLTGIDHISFIVDDVDTLYKELKDEVQFEPWEGETVWFAKVSGRKAVKVRDPNGILLQFTVKLSEYDFDQNKGN